MGICYQGTTLKQAVEERGRLFGQTGHIYGLENLDLIEEDPARFMSFQLRMVAACVNARETAKWIAASPTSLVMGELVFMLATPEGDVVSASQGLIGHVQSVPFIIRSIAELGFEEEPAIREGDIFSTNDPYYGVPHGSDCFTLVPVFYKGELIAWTVGVNHIVDVGAIQPGNFSALSPNAFTDGFLYPPLKTGENFQQHKWWELFWQRRTRTASLNILDDKMRVAGAVGLHNKVLEIVEEFGVEYFRRGVKEILEKERRQLLQRIKTMAIPGIYHFLIFNPIRYKGVVGKLFPSSDRDWLLHEPCEFHVLPDGRLLLDFEGLTSEDEFHCNCYEPGVRMVTSLGTWYMFAHTQTVNTALMYLTDYKLSPGSMFNPQNPFAGTSMGLGEAGKFQWAYPFCLSYAYFARGFIEECFPQLGGGIGYGLDGVLADGFRWAGGNLTLVTAFSSSALPYKDGEPVSYDFVPQSDLGEVEVYEFTEPTNLNIGKKLVPNYCGHGKFRSGLGIGMCHLICDPGQYLSIAAFSAFGETSRLALGTCGGYPGPTEVMYFLHETNMREMIEKGLPYPTDFVQVRESLKGGMLKARRVELYRHSTPNIEMKDGDLWASATAATNGWGDPLEREFSLAERDLRYRWLAPDVVRSIYGVVTDEEGKVKIKESEELRQQMKDRRKERSVDARDWWREEREQVLRKEFSEDVYTMYADILKYEKFRRAFMGMWQFPGDYQL